MQIVLPLPLAQWFTYVYLLGGQDQSTSGIEGCCTLCRKKYYTALIARKYETYNGTYKLKPIHLVLDASPIIYLTNFSFGGG